MTSVPAHADNPATVEPAMFWLKGRTFASWKEEFDCRGYLIFERVLSPGRVAELRTALAPFLARDLTGRNDFEGLKTNRVYALLAKSQHFAELAIHPLALAFAEAELGQSCLLSALLAINLHPGETVQPWHFDDGGARMPRPRPALGLSAFWAIDDTTELNGSTEIIPGSHLWDGQIVEGAAGPADFAGKTTPNPDHDPGNRPDAVKMIMPSGSLAIAKGTLWHRGGANRSDRPRLIITPQYCAGWVRQLENMSLAVPAEVAKKLPERARELIGYSIHPPFMGHVDGVHPRRLLQEQARRERVRAERT
jgi:ectoine hydroxylase-related dioxygenase (phytanoyl-CoA dioxygenase family)